MTAGGSCRRRSRRCEEALAGMARAITDFEMIAEGDRILVRGVGRQRQLRDARAARRP